MIFDENKIIAQAYMSMLGEKKMDPVGKEDGDIDNDGDKDKSDAYLHARRKAISTSVKKEGIDIEMPKKSSMGKELEKDEDEMDDEDDEDDVKSKSMKVKNKTTDKENGQVNELSNDTLTRYSNSARGQARHSMAKLGGATSKGEVDKLSSTMTKRLKGNAAASRKMKEEVEELDELSIKKLLTYRSKATEKLGSGTAVQDVKRKAGIGASGMKVKAKLKNEEVELDEAKDMMKVAGDIESYAKKHGGIDKSDMMKVASMLKKGDMKGAEKYTMRLDSDPRDFLLSKMGFNEAKEPPFDMPYKKAEEPKKDKSGAVHSPMSRVKHLARQAMKNQMKEQHNIEITDYQADELIEAASLQEISKATLGSYIKKAKGSIIGSAQVTGMGKNVVGQKSVEKAEKKVQKRASGINKAVDRLTREGYEWDWEAILEASDEDIDSLIEQLDNDELESFINEFDSLDEGSYQSSTGSRQPMNANGQETLEPRAEADKAFANAHKVVTAIADHPYKYNQHASQKPQAAKRPGDERNSEPKKTLSDIRKR